MWPQTCLEEGESGGEGAGEGNDGLNIRRFCFGSCQRPMNYKRLWDTACVCRKQIPREIMSSGGAASGLTMAAVAETFIFGRSVYCFQQGDRISNLRTAAKKVMSCFVETFYERDQIIMWNPPFNVLDEWPQNKKNMPPCYEH